MVDTNFSKIASNRSPLLETPLNPVDDISGLKAINRQLRKELYEIRNLLDVSLELNSVLDQERLIRSYLLNLFGFLSTKSVVILVSHSPYKDFLVPLFYQGVTETQAEQLIINKSDPLFALFTGGKKVIFEKNYDFKQSVYLSTVASVGGHALTPIIFRENVLGLVIIGGKHNEKSYSNSELENFVLLTDFLAVALTNSRLYQEMQRISLTDPLTGLFNRRHLENYLQTEVARAERFNHPVTLVMLDVDNFKNFNDHLGHPLGDHLLKHLASFLLKTVRCYDFIARYGGEEFCIVLPEIPWEGALNFSERLRRAVFSHPFEYREIQPGGRISVSLGTATYPDDALAMKELIAKADHALYQAKKNGRNQVAVYGKNVNGGMGS